MKKFKENLVCIAWSIILPVLLWGCEENGSLQVINPSELVGSWELSTTITSNDCGIPPGTQKTEVVYLEESGNELSVINFDGRWGTATLNGMELRFTGSESSDDFGCPAVLETTGSGIISGDRIHGAFTTQVSFNGGNCSDNQDCLISTDFQMTRMKECDCLSRANFGNPTESDYILPYSVGYEYSLYQSYCWPTGGHRNQLAYDFTIPIGDTIIAARGGIVKEIREDAQDDGQGYGNHNYIYIQHNDGTSAFYAHLMQNSVIIEPGDTVKMGEYIAQSGNSGESGEPHLHFGVYESYPPVEGVDVPVNFKNAEGPLDSNNGLIRGAVYKALPYK